MVKQNIRLALAASALLAFSSMGAQTLVDEKKIDAVFAHWKADEPGCSVGIVHQDKTLFSKGYGMANLEYNIPNSDKSVFRIGSTAKQFTAMAVALLAESGALSLDDNLRKYFPKFPAYADKITLSHLLHHSSGIRDYLSLSFLANWGDDFSAEQTLDLLYAQQETNFEPGSEHLYSNSGYLLLAHVVERVSGKSLKDYTQEHVFTPLLMTNSHFHDDHNHIVLNRASGYSPTNSGFEINMTILDMVGDGGVYTTTEDMRLWFNNFKNNKLGKGKQALIDLVTTPGQSTSDKTNTYAFGLVIHEYQNLKAISHGGSFVGYRAYSRLFPEHDYGISLLCNRSDADTRDKMNQISGVVMAKFIKKDDKKVESQTVVKDKAAKPLNSTEMAAYVGHIWAPEDNRFGEISIKAGKLSLKLEGRSPFEMVPTITGEFVYEELPVGYSAKFNADKTKVIFNNPDGRQSHFERFQKHHLSAQDLKMYAGIYYSAELDVEYEFTLTDGKLIIDVVDGTDGGSVTSQMKGTLNANWGVFQFDLSNRAKPTFLLQSGRVRNVKFVKVF